MTPGLARSVAASSPDLCRAHRSSVAPPTGPLPPDFPESVNGPGNGALLNISDGYLHVAGIGSIPSDLGWTIQKAKQFAPRLGVTYQLDSKTVVSAGYGRSFDTGVFGSIFGHTVTQNIPVLAKQVIQNNNIT